ncbi:MAG: hypothetical protein HUU60_04935 [Armatimonadetes bacterium]|nr:hypothetical protein [Armatimonadota bacterium]
MDSYPVDVTDETRKNCAELARLERPGVRLFEDRFDGDLKAYFEIRGLKEGKVKIEDGALRVTSTANAGRESGAGVSYWFGDRAQDRVYLRYRMKFAPDYDQGNLNHTGGGLSAVSGDNKWQGMGTAGQKPKGDDHLSSRFETWRDYGRHPSPGYLFCYVYWMDMRRDRDGNYWGNLLAPAERIVPKRGQWHWMEQMIGLNKPGEADGELAAWVDGRLYLHFKGFRWRSSPAVRLKRFGLDAYVHRAQQDNTVWFDDVVLSTGYVG